MRGEPLPAHRLRIPEGSALEQDVQLIQNLEWQEVCFIQQQHHAQLMLASLILDMLTDRGEQGSEGRPRLQSHADGELPIKVAAVDRRIVHVMDAVAALRKI